MKRQINFNRKRSEKTETNIVNVAVVQVNHLNNSLNRKIFFQFTKTPHISDGLAKYQINSFRKTKTKTKIKRMTDCNFSNKLTLKYRPLWCRLPLTWRPEWGWGREHDWKTGASMLHARVRLRLTQELENLPLSPVLQANKAYLKDCCHHHK